MSRAVRWILLVLVHVAVVCVLSKGLGMRHENESLLCFSTTTIRPCVLEPNDCKDRREEQIVICAEFLGCELVRKSTIQDLRGVWGKYVLRWERACKESCVS